MALPLLNPSGYVLGSGAATRCQRGNVGWDVRALQRALIALGHPLPQFGFDGDYGGETERSVLAYQRSKRALADDGWAGPATMQAATLDLWWPLQHEYGMPPGLGRGQLGQESALLPGNHSPARQTRRSEASRDPDADGNYFDNGVAQMASEHFSYEVAYDPPRALRSYAQRHVSYYEKYRGWGKVTDERRLRELAAGAWNAPAWTDLIANGRGSELSSSQREHIESYIDRVTYLMVIE